jgi:hypothetical protein
MEKAGTELATLQRPRDILEDGLRSRGCNGAGSINEFPS